MKNKIIIILLLVLPFSLHAQYKLNINGAVGIENGYLISSINLDKNINTPAYGYQVGLVNSYSFKKNSLNVDLSYIIKKDNRYFDNKKTTYKYHYITIPVYYGIQKNKIGFNLGFTNNFALNIEKVPSDFFIKKYNVSLLLGGTYKINEKLSFRLDLLHDITPFDYIYSYNGSEKDILGSYYMYNAMFGLSYTIFDKNN